MRTVKKAMKTLLLLLLLPPPPTTITDVTTTAIIIIRAVVGSSRTPAVDPTMNMHMTRKAKTLGQW